MFEQKHFYYSFVHSPTEQARDHWLYVHSVGWVACRADYDIQRRAFDDYQLLYVIRGRGYVEVNGIPYEARASDIVLVDLHQPYGIAPDKRDPWEFIWIDFGGQLASIYFGQLQAHHCPIAKAPSSIQGRSSEARLFKRVFELFRQPDAPKLAIDAQANSLLTRILCDLVVARVEAEVTTTPKFSDADTPDAIKLGIDYMEHRYNQSLTLQEIAHHASLSPYHFAREFKRITDFSVMGYLHELRMTQAKRLLRESHLSIREVGELVGFPDQSYFSLRFKQHEHMTPSEYRAAFQGDVGLPDESPEALRESAIRSDASADGDID